MASPSGVPTGQPTAQPTSPTGQPSRQPTGQPTHRPSNAPLILDPLKTTIRAELLPDQIVLLIGCGAGFIVLLALVGNVCYQRHHGRWDKWKVVDVAMAYTGIGAGGNGWGWGTGSGAGAGAGAGAGLEGGGAWDGYDTGPPPSPSRSLSPFRRFKSVAPAPEEEKLEF